MGGDGGVIACQRKFIRGAKSGDGEDNAPDERSSARRQIQLTRTRVCTQSGERLEEPIVCCEMGNLYKKEAMLQALLSKSVVPSCLHVRGLKDLKTLIFTPNPQYSAVQEVDGESPPMFICPITKQEFSGQQPFVMIWNTGHVLSEKAIKQLGIEALQAEYGPFSSDDVIKLNPVLEEDVDDLRDRMIARRNKIKAAKQMKKMKVKSASVELEAETGEAKAKKRKPEHRGEDVKSETGTRKITKHSAVVRSAVDAVNNQSQSKVFQGLFHSDKEKDKHDKDLFMSVAGLRYTVG